MQKTVSDFESEIRELKLRVWGLRHELELHGEQLRLKDAEIERLRNEVYVDHLTGVGNLRFFEEKVKILQDDIEPFCLAMIDLDHLKAINSENGHAMGDRVLKKLGAILLAEQRGDDHVARVGGDEFIVLLRNCHLAGAEVYLNRLQERIREDLVLQSRDGARVLRFTASLGCAERQFGEDEKSLKHRANLALLSAKNDGRDGLVLVRS